MAISRSRTCEAEQERGQEPEQAAQLNMASSLHQSLRGLCLKSGWSYAVMWKLKRRNRMVLTWEDGFYQCANLCPLNEVQQSTELRKCTGATIIGNAQQQDPLRQAIAKMSYHVYSLGEGIIGRVALTAKHQWVFGGGDKGGVIGAGGSRPFGRPNMEYHSGWQNQFAAGIKTIAVIAVSQGVIQLGSTEIVMEDLDLVAHVKSLFLSSKDLAEGLPSPSNTGTRSQGLPVPTALPHVAARAQPMPVRSASVATDPDFKSISPMGLRGPPCPLNMMLCATQSEERLHQQGGSRRLQQIMANVECQKNLEDRSYKTQRVAGLRDEVSQQPKNMQGVFGEPCLTGTPRLLSENQFVGSDGLHVSSGELLSVLGTQTQHSIQPSCLSWVPSCENSNIHSQHIMVSGACTTVANGNTMMQASVPHSPGTYSSLPCPPFKGHHLNKTMDESCREALQEVVQDQTRIESGSSWCPGPPLLNDETTMDAPVTKQLDQSSAGKACRKRCRPNEAPRPRPKDRQQIQDRVKELREIVPNSKKCSIDALLERTIKHVHLLQSVARIEGRFKDEVQGDQNGSQKLTVDDGREVVVQNLSQPRQMLVEMMCEKRGLLLQLADQIRGLGLTIVKGFMEVCCDKIRAQFVVEASRDMHRVEVLLTLMQLVKSSETVV